jgi:hypothetical protein
MKKLIVLALLIPAAACASARASVQPTDNPALEVPPAPPRAIEPLPVAPPPIELVSDLPAADVPANPPRRPPSPRDPGKPATTEQKPENKPPETPTDPTAPAQPVAQPVPALRTPGTPDGPEMARQVRDTLDRAGKLLNNVDYQLLNDDRRANYDNAKSFIKQAEAELKLNNLISAKSLADRADTIAKLLAGTK